MKHHLVATAFCPSIVKMSPQPDTANGAENAEESSVVTPHSTSAKSKKRKCSGDGEKKSKKSKQKVAS